VLDEINEIDVGKLHILDRFLLVEAVKSNSKFTKMHKFNVHLLNYLDKKVLTRLFGIYEGLDLNRQAGFIKNILDSRINLKIKQNDI
jgi:hypothetical protein